MINEQWIRTDHDGCQEGEGDNSKRTIRTITHKFILEAPTEEIAQHIIDCHNKTISAT